MNYRLPALSDSLPMQLLRLRETIMGRVKSHFKRHDLTEQQWRVMRVLAETAPIDMQRLAEGACVHPPSLSRIVPKLETRGLIRRLPSQVDHRQVLVELSEAGRHMFDRISPPVLAALNEIEEIVGSPRVQELQRALLEMTTMVRGGTIARPAIMARR